MIDWRNDATVNVQDCGGRYGHMRYGYLRKNEPELFEKLIASGEIEKHILTVNTNCEEFVERAKEKINASEEASRLSGWARSEYILTQIGYARAEAERMWVYV